MLLVMGIQFYCKICAKNRVLKLLSVLYFQWSSLHLCEICLFLCTLIDCYDYFFRDLLDLETEIL